MKRKLLIPALALGAFFMLSQLGTPSVASNGMDNGYEISYGDTTKKSCHGKAEGKACDKDKKACCKKSASADADGNAKCGDKAEKKACCKKDHKN